MEGGNDQGFNNIHGAGEALFEHYVRMRICTKGRARELALWIHMAALELGETKLAGEAGTYAKRLIGSGYGTVQGLAELDVEDLVDAGM